jgi:hypothetical protein
MDELDSLVAGHLDAIIAGQVKNGNATAKKALDILESATEEQLEAERKLAALIGFKVNEIRGFALDARRALKRKRTIVSPTDTAQIRSALEALHNRVRQAFENSVRESRGHKTAHRNDAREYARMQLWMIGAIIVNAERKGLFLISYATSVGMACVRPRERKALRIATCDRPAKG